MKSCLLPLMRNALLLAVGLFLAAAGVCHGDGRPVEGKPQALLTRNRPATSAEIAARNTHAKYEPALGCYLGAYIDFDTELKSPVANIGETLHQDPAAFERLVGKQHAMYFFYVGYGKPLPYEWVCWLAAHNKFVHIALEPNDGLDKVQNDAYLQKFADDMARSGAKIFLRFASEMNGNWTNYWKDPEEYQRKFRLVSKVMKRRAPNVAMVWCPYMIPTNTIDRYYPGDDATDWVGVNVYNVTYHNNSLLEPGEEEHPCDLLAYVYDHYAARKPMMLCEYAASHHAGCEGRIRPDFAARKILTLYNALPRLFPRIKCINYFDSNTLVFANDHASNDYSVTDNPTVNGAYRLAISSPYYLEAPLPDRAPPPPFLPMKLTSGELLQGKVRLGCWARSPSDVVTVRYKVDGREIYKTDRPDQWECVWEAQSVPPGKHTLTLESLTRDGSVVASHSVTVMTGLEASATIVPMPLSAISSRSERPFPERSPPLPFHRVHLPHF